MRLGQWEEALKVAEESAWCWHDKSSWPPHMEALLQFLRRRQQDPSLKLSASDKKALILRAVENMQLNGPWKWQNHWFLIAIPFLYQPSWNRKLATVLEQLGSLSSSLPNAWNPHPGEALDAAFFDLPPPAPSHHVDESDRDNSYLRLPASSDDPGQSPQVKEAYRRLAQDISPEVMLLPPAVDDPGRPDIDANPRAQLGKDDCNAPYCSTDLCALRLHLHSVCHSLGLAQELGMQNVACARFAQQATAASASMATAADSDHDCSDLQLPFICPATMTLQGMDWQRPVKRLDDIIRIRKATDAKGKSKAATTARLLSLRARLIWMNGDATAALEHAGKAVNLLRNHSAHRAQEECLLAHLLANDDAKGAFRRVMSPELRLKQVVTSFKATVLQDRWDENARLCLIFAYLRCGLFREALATAKSSHWMSVDASERPKHIQVLMNFLQRLQQDPTLQLSAMSLPDKLDLITSASQDIRLGGPPKYQSHWLLMAAPLLQQPSWRAAHPDVVEEIGMLCSSLPHEWQHHPDAELEAAYRGYPTSAPLHQQTYWPQPSSPGAGINGSQPLSKILEGVHSAYHHWSCSEDDNARGTLEENVAQTLHFIKNNSPHMQPQSGASPEARAVCSHVNKMCQLLGFTEDPELQKELCRRFPDQISTAGLEASASSPQPMSSANSGGDAPTEATDAGIGEHNRLPDSMKTSLFGSDAAFSLLRQRLETALAEEYIREAIKLDQLGDKSAAHRKRQVKVLVGDTKTQRIERRLLNRLRNPYLDDGLRDDQDPRHARGSSAGSANAQQSRKHARGFGPVKQDPAPEQARHPEASRRQRNLQKRKDSPGVSLQHGVCQQMQHGLLFRGFHGCKCTAVIGRAAHIRLSIKHPCFHPESSHHHVLVDVSC